MFHSLNWSIFIKLRGPLGHKFCCNLECWAQISLLHLTQYLFLQMRENSRHVSIRIQSWIKNKLGVGSLPQKRFLHFGNRTGRERVRTSSGGDGVFFTRIQSITGSLSCFVWRFSGFLIKVVELLSGKMHIYTQKQYAAYACGRMGKITAPRGPEVYFF